MSQPSAISGLQIWMRAPKTAIQQMLPHSAVIAEELGECKKQGNKETGLTPDSWDSYERNELSEPRGLHLPRHRMLNSLTWYLIFEVQTTCSLCCKFVYSLTYLPTSLEQFSHSYWDAVSWSQSPKHSHQIKQLSAFRSWLYFLVNIFLQEALNWFSKSKVATEYIHSDSHCTR